MDNDAALREHLLEVLDGESAHISLKQALSDFPVEHINTRVDGSPRTAWQLLEHIRLAQWDILDFSRNPNYKEMIFPDDYWPKGDGTPMKWKNSIAQVLSDLQSMRELVANKSTDLFAKIPHGDGQTIMREAMLVADHNAYHLGQIVLLKKILENCAAG
jgi:hypothetical protein